MPRTLRRFGSACFTFGPRQRMALSAFVASREPALPRDADQIRNKGSIWRGGHFRNPLCIDCGSRGATTGAGVCGEGNRGAGTRTRCFFSNCEPPIFGVIFLERVARRTLPSNSVCRPLFQVQFTKIVALRATSSRPRLL